jgi:hypothetical protein
MLETATKYVLDLLTENEELKKFPKEFVDESVKWVKSWFLKPEDPKTNAKLEDPNKSVEVKKDIIQDKLDDLKDNAQFQKELAAQLATFQQQRTRLKSVVSDSYIDVQGNVHIGDKGTSSGDNYDEKNIVKGSTIKAGGDFRLGDDVISGNQNVQIVHNYFGNQKGSEKTPPQYQSLKMQIETLIAEGKTEKAIETFLDTPNLEDNTRTSLLLQSGRINNLNRQLNNGVLANEEAKVERARINAAVLALVKELK